MQAQEQALSSTEIITIEEENVKLFEDKKQLEEMLERLEPFICGEVEKRASGLSPQQLSEIKQNVRIKLWRALQQRVIQYPTAYVRVIIKNVFNDLGRYSKPLNTLSLDEHGEVSLGNVLVSSSEAWGNPECVVEQREAAVYQLKRIVEAIGALPPRQQLAMTCTLFEKIDDVIQLKRVFAYSQATVEMDEWPGDVAETRRLKALIFVARKKLARLLEDDSLIA